MTTHADQPQEPRSTDEIEQELAQTREELGATVEALAAKLDVKGRSKDWARRTSADVRVKATQVVDERGREFAIGGGAVALVLLTVVIWRVRR